MLQQERPHRFQGVSAQAAVFPVWNLLSGAILGVKYIKTQELNLSPQWPYGCLWQGRGDSTAVFVQLHPCSAINRPEAKGFPINVRR